MVLKAQCILNGIHWMLVPSQVLYLGLDIVVACLEAFTIEAYWMWEFWAQAVWRNYIQGRLHRDCLRYQQMIIQESEIGNLHQHTHQNLYS